jgi:membrane-associated phospholipid phosphatase
MLYLAAKLSAFFSLPWVQRYGNKYPRIFRFLIRRFDMQDFLGLPLTLLLLILFANFSLLNELAENVVNSESMKAVDGTVTLWLYNRRTPLISQGFYYFTQLGSQYGVIAITLLSCLFLLIRRKGFYLIALILSVLGSSCSMYLLKLYFHRDRPLKVYYVPEASFSFPSGHATGAMALEGIILYFLMIESRGKREKNSWLIAGVSYILAIGFSRIYLGVHFLTDVLGGYLVGFLWVLVSIGIMEFLALRKAKENSRL